MKLSRFLILSFVTICYVQSALEINAEGIDNSWGDAYDMYVCSNSFASPATFKQEFFADVTSINDKYALSESLKHIPFVVSPFSSYQEGLKIFLKFRSLRI